MCKHRKINIDVFGQPKRRLLAAEIFAKSSGVTSSRGHIALAILRLGYIFSCGRLSYRATHHVFCDIP